MSNYVLFPFFWLGARAIRIGLKIFGPQKRIDTAQVSNFRNKMDVLSFGYLDIKYAPRVLSWIRSRWEGKDSRLFMIGVTTEQVKEAISLAKAKNGSVRKLMQIRELFLEAVDQAVALGAKNVLAAAATKRLFKPGELEKIYPGVIFTLGDNFTGLLLTKTIKWVIDFFKNPQEVKVLIISPYGLLGSVALYFTCFLGCQVIGLGHPDRKDQLEGLAKKFKFTPVYNFKDAGKVNVVIACSEARAVQVTEAVASGLRLEGESLYVIDPCEPENMTAAELKKCKGVYRFDAGNGYSPNLKYVLGWLSFRILRLTRGETWGCFCENFLISKHPELQKEENWFSVTPERIQMLQRYFGKGNGQFSLPEPTCHGKAIKIKEFPLTYSEKSKKQAKPTSILFKPISIATIRGIFL